MCRLSGAMEWRSVGPVPVARDRSTLKTKRRPTPTGGNLVQATSRRANGFFGEFLMVRMEGA